MRTIDGQLSLLEQAQVKQPWVPEDLLITSLASRTIAELDEQPPIRLDVVASFRDIVEIRKVPLASAGSLTPEERGLVMRLRASDNRMRQRFTGFHEVAHTFQPGYLEGIMNRCEPQHVRQRALDAEALSDIAACEMLMPERYFAHDLQRTAFSFSGIEDLHRTYESSIQASTYRVAALWPEPIMVVSLEPGYRKSELGDPDAAERLRVVNAWSGSGAWPFVRPNKSAGDDSPLVEALRVDSEVRRRNVDLEDLADSPLDGLELIAKAFNYRDQSGTARRRVIALYRQTKN